MYLFEFSKCICQMKVDSVPVDTCANLTLVAAWETHKNHKDGKRDLKVGLFGS